MLNKEIFFGIVQGRLSRSPKNKLQWFPQKVWKLEFKIAKKINIKFIELLTERKFNPKNPIWSMKGRKELIKIAKTNKIKLYSICADYIIDHSLYSDKKKKSYKHLINLFQAAHSLKLKVVVLPLLEKSNITKNNFLKYVEIINSLAVAAQKVNLTLCLETVLEAKYLKKFLNKINKSNVKCVFDTGNRIVFKSDLSKEIKVLGKHIFHIHIKDKNKYGENVILGEGMVNFFEVFKSLNDIKYDGPLVFETTRGNNPIITATYNKLICGSLINQVRNV